MISVLLLLQPFFTFPVFLAVLVGTPPVWIAWLIAIIPWLLRFGLTRHLTWYTPFDIPILISIGGMLLGFFLSPEQGLASQAMHTYLACVVFYYGVINNRHAVAGYWGLIGGLLGVILLFLSVWVFASGYGKEVVFNSWAYQLASSLSWPEGVKPNANVLGGAFAVIIPALIGITIFPQKSWVRWSAAILAFFFGSILVLSASGGGWIAAVAGVSVVLFYCGMKVFWVTCLVLGATAAATSPFWWDADWVAKVFPVSSLIGRLELWQATLAMLKDQPLTGLGLGGWWSKLPVVGGVHNAYLQLYSDTGVLGFVSVILAGIIGVKALRQILRLDKSSAYYGFTVGIAAGGFAGAVYAVVDVNTIVLIPARDTSIYFAVPLLWLWGALFVVSRYHLLEAEKG